MDANPRSYDNPDAAEFTRRHASFYAYLQAQDEKGAAFAFKSLRAWAYPRCRNDEAFMQAYEAAKDKELSLEAMDQLATLMKCAWHDQGLWEWGQEEEGMLEVPIPPA